MNWTDTKIFGVKWSRLLLNIQQTLYMVGWALLIGTVIGFQPFFRLRCAQTVG